MLNYLSPEMILVDLDGFQQAKCPKRSVTYLKHKKPKSESTV